MSQEIREGVFKSLLFDTATPLTRVGKQAAPGDAAVQQNASPASKDFSQALEKSNQNLSQLVKGRAINK